MVRVQSRSSTPDVQQQQFELFVERFQQLYIDPHPRHICTKQTEFPTLFSKIFHLNNNQISGITPIHKRYSIRSMELQNLENSEKELVQPVPEIAGLQSIVDQVSQYLQDIKEIQAELERHRIAYLHQDDIVAIQLKINHVLQSVKNVQKLDFEKVQKEIEDIGVQIVDYQKAGYQDVVNSIEYQDLEMSGLYYEYRCLDSAYKEFKHLEVQLRRNFAVGKSSVLQLIENYRNKVVHYEDGSLQQLLVIKGRLESFSSRFNHALHFGTEGTSEEIRIVQNSKNIIVFQKEFEQLSKQIINHEKYFIAQLYLQFKMDCRVVREKILKLVDRHYNFVGTSRDFLQRLRLLKERFEFFIRKVNYNLYFDENDVIIDKILANSARIITYREEIRQFLHQISVYPGFL